MLVVLLAAIRQLARGRVAAARRYLSRMPAASAAYGFLVALVGVSLLVLMAFTIVLIPVSLIGLVALGFGAAIGLSAALDAVARRIGMIAASTVFIVTASILPSLPGVGAVLMAGSLVTALGARRCRFSDRSDADDRPPFRRDGSGSALVDPRHKTLGTFARPGRTSGRSPSGSSAG